MSKVFISYRRDDSIETAGRIYDWLAARLPEDSVFFDVDSIMAGTDFREALDKALDQTSVMLAIVGRRWLDVTDNSGRHRLDSPEDFVRVEIETAMQRNITVVPILVQGAPMPSAQQIPESLAPFVYRNALQVRPNPDFNNDMGRVARVLESYGPDLAVASAPIAGRGPTVTRGAPLPEVQVAPVVEKQEAPPVLPIAATVRVVRGIHYPWMLRRLGYLHIAALVSFVPIILLWNINPNGCASSNPYNCPEAPVAIVVAIPFWAVGVVLFLSMFIYTLRTLGKQHRWGWFGWELVSLAPFFYPVLGLWTYGLFGPTTPAPKKPARQSAKG